MSRRQPVIRRSRCTHILGKGSFGVVYKSGDKYVLKCFKDPVNDQQHQEAELIANEIASFALDVDGVYKKFTPIIRYEDASILYNNFEICHPAVGCQYNLVSRGGMHVSNVQDAMRDKPDKSNTFNEFIMRKDGGVEFVDKLLESLYTVVNGLKNTPDKTINGYDLKGPYYHSDIKPENVFLAIDDSGTLRVRVGDFGLMTNKEKNLAGTPVFMGFHVDTAGAVVDPKSDLPDYQNIESALTPIQGKKYMFFVFKDPWIRTIYSIALTLLLVYEECHDSLAPAAAQKLYDNVTALSKRIEDHKSRSARDDLKIIDGTTASQPVPDMLAEALSTDAPHANSPSWTTATKKGDADSIITMVPQGNGNDGLDSDQTPPQKLKQNIGNGVKGLLAKLLISKRRGGTPDTMPPLQNHLIPDSHSMNHQLEGEQEAWNNLERLPDGIDMNKSYRDILHPNDESVVLLDNVDVVLKKIKESTSMEGGQSGRAGAWVGIASGLAVVLAAALFHG